MKLPLAFIFSVFTFCFAVAQTTKTDSLLNLLKTTVNDSAKVDILYQLSEESGDDNDVLNYARQALQLAEKIHYLKGISNASNNVGYVYDNRGNYMLALEYYNESLKISRVIGDKKGMGITLNNIGLVESKRGNTKKAILFCEEGLQLQQQIQDSAGMAITLNNLAISYRDLGNIPLALEYHRKSLEIKKTLKDYVGISNVLNNIAYIYNEQGKTDSAMVYYQEVLKISEETGNKRGIALAYNNIGWIMADPEKSIEYYFKSLQLMEEIGHRDGVGYILNNIADAYFRMNDLINALDYYNRSLQVRQEIGSKEGVSTEYNNIGKLFEHKGDLETAASYYTKSLALKREIGQKQGIAKLLNNVGNLYFKKGDFHTAEKYCSEALVLADSLGYPGLISSVTAYLSKIYAAQGKYKDAYLVHLRFKEMSDSLNSSQTAKTVAAMTNQFEFNKKEARTRAEFDKKDALSKKEIEKQKLTRNYIAAGFCLLILIAGVIVFLYSQRRKSKFQQTVSEVEMKALRAQMNPHFIFNSLHSINRYMNEKDTATAGDYLTRFAKVMRMILENSQHGEVPVSEDLKALELYMQLESLRMNNKFSYQIKVDESIDAENTLIPPLILQPFVENAIWHGFSTKEGNGNIFIHIEKENEMIKCTVEDNGVGRFQAVTARQQKEKKSLGMKITRSRIDIINRIRKSKAGIELTDLTQGMRVVVRLPLELAF